MVTLPRDSSRERWLSFARLATRWQGDVLLITLRRPRFGKLEGGVGSRFLQLGRHVSDLACQVTSAASARCMLDMLKISARAFLARLSLFAGFASLGQLGCLP